MNAHTANLLNHFNPRDNPINSSICAAALWYPSIRGINKINIGAECESWWFILHVRIFTYFIQKISLAYTKKNKVFIARSLKFRRVFGWKRNDSRIWVRLIRWTTTDWMKMHFYVNMNSIVRARNVYRNFCRI